MTNPAAEHLRHLFASRRRPLLGTFWPAGYPDRTAAVTHLRSFASNGASILEVGLPHHSAYLDGPTIRDAHQQAIAAGFRTDDLFDTVWQLASTPQAAVVVMTYWEPVADYGPLRFAFDLAQCGAACALIPDIPEAEMANWRSATEQAGLLNPQFVPWVTNARELDRIAGSATGWLYAPVSDRPTGHQGDLPLAHFRQRAAQLRAAVSHTPLVAGIGVSTPAHARALAPHVDGIVIGSPLIRAAQEAGAHRAGTAAAALVRDFADALQLPPADAHRGRTA